MAEQKESSVLFSLKELMNLEEDRIKEEEAEKEAKARAEREARESAERAARAAEERRLREEEEARRNEEQRRREEAARLEAIRHAEIEKAKAEAEHAARLQAMTAQQQHEAQIAAVQSDQSKKQLKIAVGVVAGFLVIGGVADHITPWQSCYRTTQLLGGKSRFVLSTSGHIAALVNPPTNTKASFQTAEDNPSDPARWLSTSQTHAGSWWNDYATWLADRAGRTKPAPGELGRGRFAPIADAPGTYVFDK